jgi:solute carrier family 20 (sodium-dependent phosphate transporter)
MKVANASAVNWMDMNRFLIAWIVAPLLSGILSIAVYWILARLILFHSDSFQRGLAATPFIYVLTIGVNVTLILYQILKKTCSDMESCSLWIGLSAAAIIATCICTYLVAALYILPIVKRRIFEKSIRSTNASTNELLAEGGATEASKLNIEIFLKKQVSAEQMALQTEQLFSFLQILSAVFTSFVHGSNDVSNSVGPLYGLFNAYQRVQNQPEITPSSPVTYGLLAYGGLGMILGLYVWGARVIETIGENLTVLSPSRGFSIEFGSALTVLIASMLRLSVSTTHCKVGSIVCVGFFSSWLAAFHNTVQTLKKSSTDIESGPKSDSQGADATIEEENIAVIKSNSSSINPKLIFSIVASWICTIPFAGLLSAFLYFCLHFLLP